MPNKSGFAHILIFPIALILIIGVGAVVYFSLSKGPNPDFAYKSENQVIENKLGDPMAEDTMKHKTSFKIGEPELLFTGGYADPTISNASTGRAVKFGTQTRLYYPDLTPIRSTDSPAAILSAVSDDGLVFTNEAGTRVDPREGFYLEGPTVFALPDGTYKMYFSENETASAEKRVSKIWGANSTDSVAWTRDDKPTIEAEVDTRGFANWEQALHPFVLTRQMIAT